MPLASVLRLVVAACLLLVSGIGPSVVYAQTSPVPTLPSMRATSLSAPPTLRLSSIDTSELEAEDAANAGTIAPYRYGVTRSVGLRADREGRWSTLPDGRALWRVEIQSSGARSVSPAFTDVVLPPGARLFVHDGANTPTIRGPYTSEVVANGAFRAPMVRGERAIVEVVMPAVRKADFSLTLDRVIHGYREILPSERDGLRKSGACNRDVACEEADPWRDQVRSVGLVSFETGLGASVCSGSLVNTVDGSKRPLFLTAEHCISTPEVAETMVFYWNYQNPTCRTLGSSENGRVTDDPVNDQTSVGAMLVARYGEVHIDGTIGGRPDLTLVEIREPLDLRFDLYFNAWSAGDADPSRAVTIHHPAGHGKRISFDDDPVQKSSYATLPNATGTTHFYIDEWELGTTEGGSSGSPLFDPDGNVIGVLSGGAAGCLPGTPDDNDEPDWYGRFAAGYTEGDFAGVTFQDFLDPNGTGAMQTGGQNLLDRDDTTPPASISDFQVTNPSGGRVELTWTAPGDDGASGRAFRYDLRVATAASLANPPLDTEAEFEQAIPLDRFVRSPEPGGTRETISFDRVSPDVDFYFALVATDDGLNASPVAFSASALRLPDRIPPGSVQSLDVSVTPAGDAIQFAWTTPMDDANLDLAFGPSGGVGAYDVRVASTPIETDADFQAATPLSLSFSPQPAGDRVETTVSDLERNAPLFFSVRAIDDEGNVSDFVSTQENLILLDGDLRAEPPTPHPVQTQTTLRFAVREQQRVRVSIYDAVGRRVRTVFDETIASNRERSIFVDTSGLPSGAYFVRYEGESTAEVQRLYVVR